VDRKVFSETVREKCALTCKDFLNNELPDMARHYLARYLASLIEGGLPDDVRGMREGFRVMEEPGDLPCVRVRLADDEHALIVLGLNLPRDRAEEAVAMLRTSRSKERLLVYLFSFESVSDEGTISNAIMEPELLQMVRDTGVVAYFAMLDVRAGMGMMARIDGDMRSIEYLPH